jgi:hypothetical protein
MRAQLFKFVFGLGRVGRVAPIAFRREGNFCFVCEPTVASRALKLWKPVDRWRLDAYVVGIVFTSHWPCHQIPY